MELPFTLTEAQELALQDMEQRVPDLAARRTGTLPNTIAGVGALLMTDAQRFALREVARTFVATAEGTDLDRLAFDHYSLTRHPSTGAVGQLRLLRTSTAVATVPVGAAFVDAAGGRYVATEATTVTGTVGLVPVRAEATGSATNRQAGTRFSAVAGFAWLNSWPGLSVVALEGLAGGNNVETDGEFRGRIGVWWQALRRGTAAAIQYAALSVPEVRRAVVSEERIRPAAGGWVDLYVTDGQDNFSWVVLNMVRQAVDGDGRAAGVVVNVFGADVVYQPVRVKMLARAGVGPDAVGRASAAIVQYVGSLAIGEGLSRARLAAAALSGDAGFVDAQVQVPAVDIAATASQLIRTRLEEVAIL